MTARETFRKGQRVRTTQHAVDDIHVDDPAIEEVITRFYDLHDAGEA